MKAVAIKEYLPIEEPNSFLDVELPKPEPTGHDILIAVQAIAVNPVDTKVRSGRGKDKGATEDPPRVLGWDASGRVEAVELSVMK
jgi:NADPH:quinone reductase-like Zn-dependent oxidoreductase